MVVGRFCLFNPSGLWEAAYGSLNDFTIHLQHQLTHVSTATATTDTVTNNKLYYFLVPTTAVHLINYPSLSFEFDFPKFLSLQMADAITLDRQGNSCVSYEHPE